MAEVVEAVRQATTIDGRIAALRRLKNYLVGHDQRKEVAVQHGAIPLLTDILNSSSRAAGKHRSGRHSSPPSTQHMTPEDELRLQATNIVGTLANGGCAFILALLSANAPAILMSSLATDSPSKLTTATLQTIKNIGSCWAASQSVSDSGTQAALDLFSEQSSRNLHAILVQQNITPALHQQRRLVTDIISICATSDAIKIELVANSSLLETLAALLAAHAVATGQTSYQGGASQLPPPPRQEDVPSILAAISTIITGSVYRAHTFFLSSVIGRLFAISGSNSDQRHRFGAKDGFVSPEDGPLLPSLHVPAHGTTTYQYSSRAFPAAAALQTSIRRGPIGLDDAPNGGDVDHANAVCSWLLVLARSMQGSDRLAALKLLALVNNAIDTDTFNSGHRSEYVQKTRERKKQMSLLAVPLAVNMVQLVNESKSIEAIGTGDRDALLVKEQACEVLALLVRDFEELQTAAVDAGAIKNVCPVLKKSFDSVPLSKPMWAPKANELDPASLPVTCVLGSKGLPSEILHAMRCRQGALQALSALSEREDVHRKLIVEAGVVPCIIDSLKPFPTDYADKLLANRGQVGPKDGNTTPVILAACRAAKTMSRSVSLLRTSLIDAGVAKPIFQLLGHQDPEVQLAATDACANLLLDFSPMRDDLVAEGVIKTLTSHARTSSAALRLSSMWALKHLVLSSPKDIKIMTLNELGSGWLVNAIEGEHRDMAPSHSNGGGVSVGLSTPNAAGEQVELLNPSTMDVDEPAEHDEDGEVMYDESSSTHYQASQLRSTLSASSSTFNSRQYLSSVREQEQNPILRAKQDDVAVQEQSLDFVRNLLNGEDCATMLDHLLQQIGSNKLFELLTAHLAPLPSSARLTGSHGRHVYGPSCLIYSTISILTHIANAMPRHKQMLIAQRTLLKTWLPHFTHQDRKVRAACLWTVNSLTWIENDGDRRDARQRAEQLRSVGIEAAARALTADADMDVKERAKTAVRQFDQLS
ncbi:hypothetical protein LTR86_000719 [Recurvomyces mirabilis]|nr:hypothetical protein LTR86_000719 [Recurvomyces mirabilis]